MQLRKWSFGIILVFIIKNLGACPNYWTSLKNISEGSFNSSDDYQFNIEQRINYKCDGGKIKLRTKISISSSDIPDGYKEHYKISKKCTNRCNNKKGTVTVLLRRWYEFGRWSGWVFWSSWSKWSTFPYVIKNCDKLYWASWTEIVNCSISREQRYARKCVDCEGEDFKFQNNCPGETTKIKQCYPSWSTWVTRNFSATNCNLTEESTKTWDCFFENKTKAFSANLCLKNLKNANISCKPKWGNLKVLCRPFWSKWMTGTCFGVNCNSTGERVRTRNCLYGDGSKSSTIKLCSNQSSIKTEQCITDFSNCSYVQSASHAKESSFLINFGISVTICIISIVIIIIVIFLRKNKKLKRNCLKLGCLNTSQNKSNNQSLSINEIYNIKPVNNIDLNNQSQFPELADAATYVNQTFSLDYLKNVQKESPESTYEMALENGDKTPEDLNNVYNHLKKSDQSHSDEDNTYNHIKKI